MKNWQAWIRGAKKGNKADMTAILETIQPKIKKALQQTHYQNQEDLEQVLIEKTLHIVTTYDETAVPGFWEFKDKWYDRKNQTS